MKVFLATSGEYSDFTVRHVFAREEDARAYRLADDVEEYELRDGPVDVRYWCTLTWYPDIPDRPGDHNAVANPCEFSALEDFDADKKLSHRWAPYMNNRELLYVCGWDREAVRKVYTEQRGQYEARKAGLT